MESLEIGHHSWKLLSFNQRYAHRRGLSRCKRGIKQASPSRVTAVGMACIYCQLHLQIGSRVCHVLACVSSRSSEAASQSNSSFQQIHFPGRWTSMPRERRCSEQRRSRGAACSAPFTGSHEQGFEACNCLASPTILYFWYDPHTVIQTNIIGKSMI